MFDPDLRLQLARERQRDDLALAAEYGRAAAARPRLEPASLLGLVHRRFGSQTCDPSDMRVPHGVIRRALANPLQVLGRVAPGDLPAAQRAALYYSTVLELLHLHDTAEDAVLWPQLRLKVPASRLLLSRMELQHASIDAAAGGARIALLAYLHTPDLGSTSRLAMALTHLGRVAEPHLREEEAHLLPVAAVSMAQGEWDEMPRNAMRRYSGEHPWLVAGLMAEQMTDKRRAKAMIQVVPPALRRGWGPAGSRDYTRFMAAIRG